MSTPLHRFIPVVCVGLLTALTFSGCETPGQTALAGAATGAAIGGLIHGRGRDALTGAAIGAGAGYVAGKIAQQRRGERYRDARYPVGALTSRRGFVESPYPPYNLIDVRGIPSGARVMDPSVNRVFIAP